LIKYFVKGNDLANREKPNMKTYLLSAVASLALVAGMASAEEVRVYNWIISMKNC